MKATYFALVVLALVVCARTDGDNQTPDHKVKSEVIDEVKSEVIDEVKSEVIDEVKSEVIDEVKDKVKSVIEPNLFSICTLPKDHGSVCDFEIPSTRFAFKLSGRACESFVYNGCGGNANNFDSLVECRKTCEMN